MNALSECSGGSRIFSLENCEDAVGLKSALGRSGSFLTVLRVRLPEPRNMPTSLPLTCHSCCGSAPILNSFPGGFFPYCTLRWGRKATAVQFYVMSALPFTFHTGSKPTFVALLRLWTSVCPEHFQLGPRPHLHF